MNGQVNDGFSGDQLELEEYPHLTILAVVSVVLIGIRIMGVTHESYQAIVHLWTGGLFGAFFVLRARRLPGRYRYLLLGVVLTLVEAACFLLGIGSH